LHAAAGASPLDLADGIRAVLRESPPTAEDA